MEYKKVWKVFDGEGYTIDEGTDGYNTPSEALQAALDRGYDLQSMINDCYTIALVLEDEYTWIEILDAVPVARVVEFYGMKEEADALCSN